jgi:DNA adenine methylase
MARTVRILEEKRTSDCRPLLKWAGGKTQMLSNILPIMPKNYGRFIEPFFGGGALFFSVKPSGGLIADSNPELVNLYSSVANDVDGVMGQLALYENTEDIYYALRALDWTNMPSAEAAARTIFLVHPTFPWVT